MVLETLRQGALLVTGLPQALDRRMKAKRPRTAGSRRWSGWPSPSSPYDRRGAAVASLGRRQPQDRKIP
jgi:hypothetical protein